MKCVMMGKGPSAKHYKREGDELLFAINESIIYYSENDVIDYLAITDYGPQLFIPKELFRKVKYIIVPEIIGRPNYKSYDFGDRKMPHNGKEGCTMFISEVREFGFKGEFIFHNLFCKRRNKEFPTLVRRLIDTGQICLSFMENILKTDECETYGFHKGNGYDNGIKKMLGQNGDHFKQKSRRFRAMDAFISSLKMKIVIK